MKSIIVDTNVLVRFFLGEPEEHASAAAYLFEKSDKGEVRLILDQLVVAETIFVLSSFYKVDRPEVAEAMKRLLGSRGIECSKKVEILRALSHFVNSRVHWVDCYLAALSENEQKPVISFDRDFDKLSGATRVDPFLFASSR